MELFGVKNFSALETFNELRIFIAGDDADLRVLAVKVHVTNRFGNAALPQAPDDSDFYPQSALCQRHSPNLIIIIV